MYINMCIYIYIHRYINVDRSITMEINRGITATAK